MTRVGGEVAISTRGLTRRFGELVAVDGLDLEVRAGECFGLLGPNGAGKTTTVEMLEGLTPPDGGEIALFGESWRRGGRRLRERLGVALQETRLPDKLTVQETVRLFRSFYRHGPSVDSVIDLLGLTEKRRTQVGQLSGGQRQRLALAAALVGAPELLFLDEPTTGLDPQARHRIWQVIEEFRGDGGTVLLTTHSMEEAQHLCDRVAIMDRGRCIAMDSPAALVATLGAPWVIECLAPGLTHTDVATLPGLVGAESHHDQLRLRVASLEESLPPLLALVAARGIELRSLTTRQATLEDLYLHMTGRALRDG